MPGKILALYLDAPLQSWGYASQFDRRTSLGHPTRSGVLGMICAALGVDWSDVEGLNRLDGLSMTVLGFGGGARLTDFHTVGGGYDRKAEKQNIVRTAEGKIGKTMVTHREYLQDARFGVLLCGDDALLVEIAAALTNPRWGLWLGRKSCIPASPVCQGMFDSEELAEEHLCTLDAPRRSRPDLGRPRKWVEVDDFDSGTDTIMDRPLDFAERRFAPRRIAEE
jgi:CRISPR system Cascade subunit CasD